VPISVGSVQVDVYPSTQGIYRRLRDGLVPAATRAGQDAGSAAGRAFAPAMASSIDNTAAAAIGERIGQAVAARIVAQIRTSLAEGIDQGGARATPAATRQGDQTAGAFARAMRARLTEAYRTMPRLDVSIADTGVDAELARLRARLETLSNKRIGVDVDVAAADAEIAGIEAELTRLGAAHPNVAVRADTAAARAALASIREDIDRLSARPGVVRVETDGSFGARLRASVQAAEAALPNINIDANTSAAEAQIASLRAQLTAMRDVRVGVDIDAATATARIDAILARLRLLGATSSDIAVRVDAAAAEAQLAAVGAMASALDGRTANLHVSNAQAMSAVFQVAVAIAALGAIPAVPVLAAGAGSLVASFSAAGIGVGALAAAALPAINSIKGALDAQKQAQDASTTAAAKGGQVAAQAAQRSLQMAGAQQALAAAERSGAQQIEQARQGVATAIQQAAQAQQQADRAVVSAETNLTQAQKAATQAQLDLVTARKTAAEQLVDLNNQLTDSQLAQQQATDQVQEAQLALNQTLADPKATQLQRQEAQLAYAQAVQQLKEQTLATGRLADQTAAANKAGVAGSATYTQAQDALAQAQQDVTDKTQALADARKADAQTEQQNARSIADAQAKVAQAQQSAADSISSAQRQVQAASLSAAGGVDQSATAAQKYRDALDKLSPSARETFNAFLAARTAYKAWSMALQPEIMPIFTRGINGAKAALPGLTPLVDGAAKGITTLQEKVSRGFKSPWWQSLKKDFQTSVEPALVGIGTAVGDVFIGTAGIIDAFLPHIDSISRRTDSITARYKNFGKNLKGSPAFENFLSYSSDEAGKLGSALGKIVTAFLGVSKAVAPLSGAALTVVGGFAMAIGSIADNAPGALQLIYGIYVASKLAALAQAGWNAAVLVYKGYVVLTTLVTEGWTAAQLAADAAFDANPLVAIIVIIIAAVVLLVAAVLYAWNHFAWFRDSVKAVWAAILISVQVVVAWFNKDFIPFFAKTLPGWIMWLLGWTKAHWGLILGILAGPVGLAVWAVLHYWGNIEKGFSDGWNWLKKYVFNPVGNFFTKTIPGWAESMGDKTVGAFDDARAGISRVWGKIEDAAKKPVNFVIGTVWNQGILAVWKKVGGWIPGLPKLGKLPLLAQGGTLPVQPGLFNRPTAIVGEGRSQYPEYVIPTDPKYRARALGLLEQAGTQMLSGGGIIGTITGGVTGVAKDVGGAVASGARGAWRGISTAASFLRDPVGNLERVLTPELTSLKALDDTAWGKAVAALPRTAIEGLKKLVGLGGSGGSGGGGGIPSGQHRSIITRALAAAHVPPPGLLMQWLAGLNTLITRESGWNPAAVNRTDINAREGHPSQGLAQTIPSTWAHYVPASLRSRGILDPVGNVAAAIRYIVSRYGNITRVQQANPGLPPKGYDAGGYLQPGLNLAYNGTGRPEPVFTSAQADALLDRPAAPVAAGFTPGQPVTLLVQDGPTLRAYVSGVADTQVGAALTTVRRVAASH
jgi:hypothetical protein